MSNRTPRTVPEFREAYKRYFADGTLRIEKGEIIAKAKDGQEVRIGETIFAGGVERAARYLESHPHPDLW